MTTTVKASSRRAPASPVGGGAQPAVWLAPPATLEEHLQRIKVMNDRIRGYVEYMGTIDNLTGTSAEAKEKAIAAFYERMVVLERHLGRIQEDLRLG